MRQAVARPAVFGLADGMMSLLGVVLYLLGHQALIFPAAVSGAISSAVSMAAGQWLSDPDRGLPAAAVMGAATGAGAVLPAVPFAFTSGTAAVGESVWICVLVSLTVALLRPGRRWQRAVTETFLVLGAVFAVVLICGMWLPGSAA